MRRYTGAEARALREAATAGPWRGDRNDGTVKYAILAGDHETPIVVLSVDHKNGTYGFGCGYGDADETRYADDPSADERLALAAPDLAATVEALEAERDGERDAVVAYLLAEADEHQRSHEETGRGPAMSRYADMRDALLFVAKRIEAGKHRSAP